MSASSISFVLVADNYAPMVAHILFDALLNPEYLHLPRTALFGQKINPKEETSQMVLLYDLFAGGTTEWNKVNKRSLSLLVTLL